MFLTENAGRGREEKNASNARTFTVEVGDLTTEFSRWVFQVTCLTI